MICKDILSPFCTLLVTDIDALFLGVARKLIILLVLIGMSHSSVQRVAGIVVSASVSVSNMHKSWMLHYSNLLVNWL